MGRRTEDERKGGGLEEGKGHARGESRNSSNGTCVMDEETRGWILGSGDLSTADQSNIYRERNKQNESRGRGEEQWSPAGRQNNKPCKASQNVWTVEREENISTETWT